jgi:hypothetical protein
MLVEMKHPQSIREVVALNDVDFSIEKGRIHGVLEKTERARPPHEHPVQMLPDGPRK